MIIVSKDFSPDGVYSDKALYFKTSDVEELRRFYQDIVDEKRDVELQGDDDMVLRYYKRFVERIRKMLNKIQLDEDACRIVNRYREPQYDSLKHEDLPYSSVIPEYDFPVTQIRYYLAFIYILYEDLQQQIKNMESYK